MRIFLIGMMGSGKSSVGELLSKSLNLNFVDIDQVIQKKEGKTINDIFKKRGETYFREIENIELKKIKDLGNNLLAMFLKILFYLVKA